MRPVKNSRESRFPKVGDHIQVLSGGTIRTVVDIAFCDHRHACRQDDNCHYCLTLKTNPDGHPHQHCWNRDDGTPWWRIVF
jgi:hypothetical protein